jgi:tRNA(Arg) A34 adenosine deaminase TadA
MLHYSPMAARLTIDLPAWVEAATADGQTLRDDHDKMALVIRLAEENARRGEGGPFGASVFELGSGRVVAAGVNRVVQAANFILHAELLALMFAQQRVGSSTLRTPGGSGHELVTSCEPCAMCLGATRWSGVSRLVIGTERADAMSVGFEEGLVFAESYAYIAERGVETVRGIRRDEAARLLHAYRDAGGSIDDAGS